MSIDYSGFLHVVRLWYFIQDSHIKHIASTVGVCDWTNDAASFCDYKSPEPFGCVSYWGISMACFVQDRMVS